MDAPRWRLTEPHYLNVPGTEWEQKETSQQTRRQVTKRYPVPLLLDPKEPSDFNYPDEVIVAHEGSKMPRDIIFIGPPTLAMEPLNDAAQKLSDEVAAKAVHPIDSLPANGGFTEQLLARLTQQLEQAINRAGGIPKGETVPNTAIPADALGGLQAQINALMEKNAELERRIAQAEEADAEPLPPADAPTPAEIAASEAQAAANKAAARRT